MIDNLFHCDIGIGSTQGGDGTIRASVRLKSILELLVGTLKQLCEVGSVSTAIDEYVMKAVE